MPPDSPTFAATGYTVDMADYKYNPTQEFNFPHHRGHEGPPVKNALGDNAYRYYLFYAPHNNPGGNCVAVSNSLEGPLDRVWEQSRGEERVGAEL